MDTHVRLLGLLQIAVGALNGLVAIIVIAFFGGAYVLSAALSVNTIVAGVWLGAAILLMAPSVGIGIGLLGVKGWSRVAGIILSIVEMVVLPLGLIVGLYGLWVLFSEDVDAVFNRRFGDQMVTRR